ncbi:MAG: rRNA pseudouridine synthase [Deltaproteobacteria bacterium]|nr:rRNA pseudouridine synthase [Deltaproteobacteria bacterium]MBW2137006.1 rRNA pseudouridine synthase [Deltaproteobacteria bacterium]
MGPSQGQDKPLRINRILSLAGVCSRRKADEWILEGRVKVNDSVLTRPGARAFWGVDSIKVDDREVPHPSGRVYLMLNKPFGYISSLNDPRGRPLAMHLLRDIKKRVYPVGRLDFDSLGLLLFTDDGELSHRLMHPRYHIPKTYKITIRGLISGNTLETLRKGLDLEDGFTGPAKVTLLERRHDRSVIRMTITAGRNRLIRRMLHRVGHDVMHLVRVGFGPLELGYLKIGHYRHLDDWEVRSLEKMAGLA